MNEVWIEEEHLNDDFYKMVEFKIKQML